MKSPQMIFNEDNFDAIIVGSGPGGVTVARELAIKNTKVLILEWGDYQPLRGSFAQGCGYLLIAQIKATTMFTKTSGMHKLVVRLSFELKALTIIPSAVVLQDLLLGCVPQKIRALSNIMMENIWQKPASTSKGP